jgi:hypothetical protein
VNDADDPAERAVEAGRVGEQLGPAAGAEADDEAAPPRRLLERVVGRLLDVDPVIAEEQRAQRFPDPERLLQIGRGERRGIGG